MTEHNAHVLSKNSKKKPNGHDAHGHGLNHKECNSANNHVSNGLNLVQIYAAAKQGESPTPVSEQTHNANNELFEHPNHPLEDIRPDNVWVGELNDCYFLGSLDEVAAQDPELILKMFSKNADGTYDVTFPGDLHHPVKDIPLPSPVDLVRNASYSSGLWANMIEKAHRIRTGKWANSGNGNWTPEEGDVPDQSLKLLTGKDVVKAHLSLGDIQKDFDGRATRKDLQGHPTPTDWDAILKRAFANKEEVVAVCGKDGKDYPVPNGTVPPLALSDSHAYPVLGYKNGVVVLREMRKHHVTDSAHSGEFTMSLEDFKSHFDYVAWTHDK